MVAFIKEWLQQVLIVLVLAAFFDMLMPRNSLHKYIKLVVSLCILLTLLLPVVRLVGGDARDWLAVEWRQKVAPEHAQDATNQVVAQRSEWIIEQTESLVEQRMSSELSAFLRNVLTWSASCMVDASFKNQAIEAIEQVICTIGQDVAMHADHHRALEDRVRSYVAEQWHAKVGRISIDVGGVEVVP